MSLSRDRIAVPKPVLYGPDGEILPSTSDAQAFFRASFDRNLRSGAFGSKFNETLDQAMRRRDSEREREKRQAENRSSNSLTPVVEDVESDSRASEKRRVYSFGRGK